MNKIVKLILVGIALYVAFAASILTFYKDDPSRMHWEDREAFNIQFISKLSLTDATTQKTVIDYLGSPDLTEAQKINDVVYQVLFYRTQRTKSDGFTTRDECTPMLFKDGVLIAIGASAWQTYKAL